MAESWMMRVAQEHELGEDARWQIPVAQLSLFEVMT
jgi:hypothetical protein